jgi:kynurenine formamidase
MARAHFWRKPMPVLIDLSREIHHRTPTHPSHPPVTMMRWNSHDEVKQAEDVVFTSASLFMTMGDHAGTHVDAPVHFDADPNAKTIDQVPLENFYTSAFCLDLSHKPLKSDISIAELEAAEAASGETIRAGDTIFLHMGFNDRVPIDSPGYVTDFSGLTKESAEWLGAKGIVSFGVEAISPARPGRNNYLVHQVCRDMGFTHMECLVNLDKLVGKGRFRFAGFPLKIRGGTGSPIRAVAIFDD